MLPTTAPQSDLPGLLKGNIGVLCCLLESKHINGGRADAGKKVDNRYTTYKEKNKLWLVKASWASRAYPLLGLDSLQAKRAQAIKS